MNRIIFIGLLFFITIQPAFGQAVSDDKVKATFIHNFSIYINWPEEEKIETFTIGFLGQENAGIRSELENKLKTKTFNGKPFAIKVFKNTTEVKDVQMLYVNGDDDYEQARVFRKIKGKKILLVAENFSDFNKSMINFIDQEGKIKYSFNKKTIDAEGFTYDESVAKMGILNETGWKDVYTKYREMLESDKKKIVMSKKDLETMLNTHDEQNKAIAQQKLENERSLEEIEKLSFEAQAKELKIRAQNDEIRRNKLEAVNQEQENELLRQEKLIQETESQSQQRVIMVVSFALGLIVIFLFFVVRSWLIMRKQKIIITAQKTRVEQQKEMILSAKLTIEEKNKDITDSITYAKRIQQAKLPIKEKIYMHLPECFILFKPKDIVSGDFYFFRATQNDFFIAVGDCTGHGVPGAFMSLISTDKLEEALHQSDDPADILTRLNNAMKLSLNQNEGEDVTRDGMDIALCRIDTLGRNMIYSGANRPLWIIRKDRNEIDEIKATKKAIGGFTDDGQLYDTHSLQLEKGDTFYIFSDGYADTFSGYDGKKLTTKKFKEVLLMIQEKNMQEQEQFLEKFIENWKAGTEQVDDICIIGVRV